MLFNSIHIGFQHRDRLIAEYATVKPGETATPATETPMSMSFRHAPAPRLDDCDLYAVESQKRAAAAWDDHRFSRSVFTVRDRNRQT